MQLDSIGILFANSWKRYKERFTVIASIFFFPIILVGIGELLAARQTPPTMILGGVLSFLGVIISIASSTAMISAVGKGTNFKDSYKTGFRLFWAGIWITLLTLAATFGGYVLLIIPGIILAVQLSLAIYVLVLEDKHGMEALAESREYVKGYWWAFIGRGLLLGLILIVLLLIIYIPVNLIFGGIVGGIVYGLLLLLITPFSICYQCEIYDNLRRLKPNAAEDAAKAERGFLKVAMVFGILGWIAITVLFIMLIAWGVAHPGGSQYQYTYSGTPGGDTTLDGGQAQMELSPTSGPVGTMVTITGPVPFDATNTIFMNGNVAAKDIAPADDGSLMFAVPDTLGPDCNPGEMCAQYLISVTPGYYGVGVKNSQGLVTAGVFTVETSTDE